MARIKTSIQSITLREETPADLQMCMTLFMSERLDEIAALRVRGFSEEYIENHFKMQFKWQNEHYNKRYMGIRRDLVEMNENFIGRFYVDRGYFDYRIVDLVLLPEFQGRGIAGTLIRDLCSEAARNNMPVSLHVLRQKPKIIGLYQKLGFVECAGRSESEDSHAYMEWRSQEPRRSIVIMA